MLAVLLRFIGIEPLALNLEDVVCCIDSGVQYSDACDSFLGKQPRNEFP